MFGSIGGLAKSAFGAVKAAASEENPVTAQVQMFYERLVRAIPVNTPATQIPMVKVRAARATEITVFKGVGPLVERIAASGKKKVTALEACHKAIEEVRDLKLTALEDDGNVSLLIDLPRIRCEARTLRAPAEKYLNNLCMERGNATIDGPLLDEVEDLLFADAKESHGGQFETQMRAEQGAIFAVADLRIKYLATPKR